MHAPGTLTKTRASASSPPRGRPGRTRGTSPRNRRTGCGRRARAPSGSPAARSRSGTRPRPARASSSTPRPPPATEHTQRRGRHNDTAPARARIREDYKCSDAPTRVAPALTLPLATMQDMLAHDCTRRMGASATGDRVLKQANHLCSPIAGGERSRSRCRRRRALLDAGRGRGRQRLGRQGLCHGGHLSVRGSGVQARIRHRDHATLGCAPQRKRRQQADHSKTWARPRTG